MEVFPAPRKPVNTVMGIGEGIVISAGIYFDFQISSWVT
jgi:hypothetical protein